MNFHNRPKADLPELVKRPLRYILVRVSKQRWIVAERLVYAPHKFKAITKRLDRVAAERIYDEVRELSASEYSAETREAVID